MYTRVVGAGAGARVLRAPKMFGLRVSGICLRESGRHTGEIKRMKRLYLYALHTERAVHIFET